MKIYVYITLIISCLSNFLVAQNRKNPHSLSGKVIYNNGEPVEMATVLIKNTKNYTLTNDEGFFHFEKLLLGKIYEIEVKPFDGQAVTTKADLTQKPQHLIIKLKNDGVNTLSEVIVSGKNKSKQTKEQGYAMNVISTKEASLQNIQTTELLGRSAGVKIRQTAGLGSDISFNLNGLTGNSVRIFIDGIPIRNYGRSFSLSTIPPSMIERIEVYKGILPSELSEDALGGGINVVLKKDMKTNLTTSYSYGSFNTHQWDLNANYRNRKNGLTVNLSSFHNHTDNNYKVWGENVYVTNNTTGEYDYVVAKRFHDSYYSAGIRGNAGFTQKKWADELLFGFMFSQTEKDIQTGATMQVVYGNRKTAYNSRMASLQYKKNDLLVKGLDFSTFTTYSKTMRQVIDTVPYIYTWEGKRAIGFDGKPLKWLSGAEGTTPTLAMNDERNLANRSNIHYHLGKHQTFGASYFLGTFRRKVDDPLQPAQIRALMDERKYHKQIWSFNYDLALFRNKFKSSVFYKLYEQSVYLTEYELVRRPNGIIQESATTHDKTTKDNGYGITISYAIIPKITISVSAEKAIRLPESSELLGNFSDGVSASIGLKPEQSMNLNLGLNVSGFKIGKHEIGGEMNLFQRDVKDMITRGIPRPSDDFFRFENLGKIISRGVDAELRYNWNKRLFFNGNISYFDARFNLERDPATGLKYAHYRSRLRNAPYFTSNINAEYVLENIIQEKSRLVLNYNFGYTHQFFKEWEAYGAVGKIIIPTQPLHDLGVTYTFPSRKITLALNAKNIFDTQVFDNYALQKPGRAIYGKITFSAL